MAEKELTKPLVPSGGKPPAAWDKLLEETKAMPKPAPGQAVEIKRMSRSRMQATIASFATMRAQAEEPTQDLLQARALRALVYGEISKAFVALGGKLHPDDYAELLRDMITHHNPETFCSFLQASLDALPERYHDGIWKLAAASAADGLARFNKKSGQAESPFLLKAFLNTDCAIPDEKLALVLAHLVTKNEFAMHMHAFMLAGFVPEAQRTDKLMGQVGVRLESAAPVEDLEKLKFLPPEQQSSILRKWYSIPGTEAQKISLVELGLKLPSPFKELFLDSALAYACKVMEKGDHDEARHVAATFRMLPYPVLVESAFKCEWTDIFLAAMDLVRHSSTNIFAMDVWMRIEDRLMKLFSTPKKPHRDPSEFRKELRIGLWALSLAVESHDSEQARRLLLAAINGKNFYTRLAAIQLISNLPREDKTPDLWARAYKQLDRTTDLPLAYGVSSSDANLIAMICALPATPITWWQRLRKTSYRKTMLQKVIKKGMEKGAALLDGKVLFGDAYLRAAVSELRKMEGEEHGS